MVGLKAFFLRRLEPRPERILAEGLESLVSRHCAVVSQRRKPAAVGTKLPYPGFVEPALATSVEHVPPGDRWVHEIKFDGYRVQMHLGDGRVTVYTRRGHDWTKRFRKVADDAGEIVVGSAIIDGEVVVPQANGATDFSVLQKRAEGSL